MSGFFFVVMLISVAVVTTGFRNVWKEFPAHHTDLLGIALFLPLYCSVHFFWHIASTRYAIPILPILLIFGIRGVHAWLEPFERHKMWTGVTFALLLATYGIKNAEAIHDSFFTPDPGNLPPRESLNWLKDHTAPHAKVLSIIAPSVELFANRSCLTGVKAFNADMFLFDIQRAGLSYVVDRNVNALTSGVGDTEDINAIWNQIRVWLASYPGRFRRVYGNETEQTTIYEVTASPGYLQAYDAYCSASRAYLSGHEEEAFVWLKKSQALDPTLGTAANLLGGLYMRRHDFPQAEAAFLKSVQLLPDSPSARVNLASLYRLAGRTALSDDYGRQALQISIANGDEKEFTVRLQSLHHLWDNHQMILWMDLL
jgi:hypothetical protein